MHILINIILNALAVYVTAYLLPGVTLSGGYTAILITALIIALLNSIVKPILNLITLPVQILTLGLFTFITSGLIILLADYLINEFMVANIWWAILFSVVLSIVNSALQAIFE